MSLRYFRFGDVDDRCQPGVTLFWWLERRLSWRFNWRLCMHRWHDYKRVHWGFSRQWRAKRGFGIRMVIDLPLPFTREFDMDYRRYRQQCRANVRLSIELARWLRPIVACGIQPSTPTGPRIARHESVSA